MRRPLNSLSRNKPQTHTGSYNERRKGVQGSRSYPDAHVMLHTLLFRRCTCSKHIIDALCMRRIVRSLPMTDRHNNIHGRDRAATCFLYIYPPYHPRVYLCTASTYATCFSINNLSDESPIGFRIDITLSGARLAGRKATRDSLFD